MMTVKITNLGKSFRPPHPLFKNKPAPALTGINLEARNGETIGILGPNGAGKTTLLKIMAALIRPDTGQVICGPYMLGTDGHDLAVKRMTGLAFSDERSFYWRLTGRQNLEFFGALYGLTGQALKARINGLFKHFHISYGDRRFDAYSTGMKRTFSIMRSVLHQPDILLLDEPFKSLDPSSRTHVSRMITASKFEGKTVFLATHELDRAGGLCDRFLILNGGKTAAWGTIPEIRSRHRLDGTADLRKIYDYVSQRSC